MQPMIDRAEFEQNGFVLVPRVVGGTTLQQLRELTSDFADSPGQRRGGVRDPFETVDGLLEAVRSTPIGKLAAEVLGPGVFVVRSILFDKRPDTNWSVSWHRDETIAVAERADLPGFGPWSYKARVPNAHAPRSVLDAMATLRLHLDDTPTSNGPLRVLPGSHRTDDAPPAGMDGTRLVEAEAGDVLVMRPRLLHASSKQTAPGSRRVLHIECAAASLPHPLCWHRRVSLLSRAVM